MSIRCDPGIWCPKYGRYIFDIGRYGDVADNITVTQKTAAPMTVVVSVAGEDAWTYTDALRQIVVPSALCLLRTRGLSTFVEVMCPENAQPVLHVTYRCYDSLVKRKCVASVPVHSVADYLCTWDE